MNKTNNINLDFKKNIWCILGLPFEDYSLEDACAIIEDNIMHNSKCILSTPNLNWVVGSFRDTEFKKSIINSDVSIIDGTPILWVSRFLGLPFKEKVPGSTLIAYILTTKKDKNYKIFFFGGEGDAAKEAFLAVNTIKSNIRAVGYYFPGYGSVDEMSADGIIYEINKTKPDILLIALGAKKGMAWIAKNKDKLNAKIISHLGASINFIGGIERRAPIWMQKSGLEWLWRIKEEPRLWKRYLKDGVIFIYLFMTRVLPYKLFLMANKKYILIDKEPIVKIIEDDSTIKIKITGVCNYLNSNMIRNYFRDSVEKHKDIVLDLTKTDHADNSFLGLLLLLYKYQTLFQKAIVIDANKKIKKIFRVNLLDDIFSRALN